MSLSHDIRPVAPSSSPSTICPSYLRAATYRQALATHFRLRVEAAKNGEHVTI